MMLAGLPVPNNAVAGLALLVLDVDDVLSHRLRRAVEDDVKLLALRLDERAIMLAALEDPPDELAELRAVCSQIISGGVVKRLTNSSAVVSPVFGLIGLTSTPLLGRSLS